MNMQFKLGLVSALAATACMLLPVSSQAADLYGGSTKDGYAPSYAAPSIAGPCYLRGDVGYGWPGGPSGRYVGNATDPNVYDASLDAGMLYEAGIGCGSGSRGLRADLTVGIRQGRDFSGTVNAATPATPFSTSIDTYTVMANGYYDFGNFRGFVPYLGAGIGVAMHDMGNVTMSDPSAPTTQHGDTKVDLAWSLMAGVGYQLTSNTILDVGYRYINMGSAASGTTDLALANTPKLSVRDIDAHEFKVGLRYHFGGSSAGYVPMK